MLIISSTFSNCESNLLLLGLLLCFCYVFFNAPGIFLDTALWALESYDKILNQHKPVPVKKPFIAQF